MNCGGLTLESLRARLARATPSAAVYQSCPRYLLVVLVVLLIGEVGAALLDLPPPHEAMSASGVLVTGLVLLVVVAGVSIPRSLRQWGWCASAGLILPLGNTIMPAALAATVAFLPHSYDQHVAALDATLGGQPSFVLGALFVRWPDLEWFCRIVYAAVLLPTAVLALAEGHHGRRVGIGALPTFLVIAGAGFVSYHILPVIGPMAYFGDQFPLPSLRAHLPGPRNCMPSLHTAWVLMPFLCARGMKLARAISLFCLLFMLLATLGFGEHYLLDLVCAVPFVLAIRALCATELPLSAPSRYGALLFGTAVFAIWGLAVRGVINPTGVPGLVPVMMLATVVVSLLAERRLAQAQGLLDRLPLPKALQEANAVVVDSPQM